MTDFTEFLQRVSNDHKLQIDTFTYSVFNLYSKIQQNIGLSK